MRSNLAIVIAPLLVVIVASSPNLLLSVQQKFNVSKAGGLTEWKHACSGVLLRVDTVVTCCTCLTYQDERLQSFPVQAANLRVFAGERDPEDDGQNRNTQTALGGSVRTHPKCVNADTGSIVHRYDYGILVLKTPLKVGSAALVMDIDLFGGNKNRNCEAMGWNFYYNGEPIASVTKRRSFTVTIHKAAECSPIIDPKADLEQFKGTSCALSMENMPICLVDPGSPIVCDKKLVAIVTNHNLLCEASDMHVTIAPTGGVSQFLTTPEPVLTPGPDSTPKPDLTSEPNSVSIKKVNRDSLVPPDSNEEPEIRSAEICESGHVDVKTASAAIQQRSLLLFLVLAHTVLYTLQSSKYNY